MSSTTNDQGAPTTVTSIQTITSAAPVGVTPHNDTSSSHTGAIVGGVVGGVGGLALLLLVIFFFVRRRKRDDFDGNFDPDRVVGLSGRNDGTLPNIDLAGADEVTPYTYNPAGPNGTGGAAMDDGSMRQAGNVPAFLAGGMAGAGAGALAAAKGRPGSASPPATSAPSAYSQSQSQSHYAPSSSEPSQYPDYTAYNQYAQQGPQGYNPGGFAAEFQRQPSAGPSSGYTQTGSGTGSSGQPLLGGVLPSAKEREAYQRRTGMTLANPGEVVQHEDAGRVPQPSSPEEEEGEPPMEVPPRYDQIRD